MADEVVKICDARGCDKRGKGIEHYEIDMPGGILRADLCKDHAKVIRDLVSVLPPHLFVKISGHDPRTRSTGFQKVTMEDIDRLREN